MQTTLYEHVQYNKTDQGWYFIFSIQTITEYDSSVTVDSWRGRKKTNEGEDREGRGTLHCGFVVKQILQNSAFIN